MEAFLDSHTGEIIVMERLLTLERFSFWQELTTFLFSPTMAGDIDTVPLFFTADDRSVVVTWKPAVQAAFEALTFNVLKG